MFPLNATLQFVTERGNRPVETEQVDSWLSELRSARAINYWFAGRSFGVLSESWCIDWLKLRGREVGRRSRSGDEWHHLADQLVQPIPSRL